MSSSGGRCLRSDSQFVRRGRPSAAGNAAISLGGAVAPALVALVVIPMLVRALGAELFGLLSFIWIVFGTFAVLDFGTGRATTKFVAELLASERTAGIPALFWSASAINLGVAVLCGLLLYVLAPWLGVHVVKVPDALHPTAVVALRITAFALPWIVLGGVFRSALEGLQRFDLSNAVQLPVSALNYIAPLVVARAGGSLPWVIGAVCLTRMSAVPPLFMLCRRQLPMLGRPQVTRRQMRRLVGFGSWLTVSNVVGPLLLSLDRLFVGSILGAGALGLYAPVYELVTRLSLVPASVRSAIVHVIELPIHAAVTWWAVSRFGVVGAAAAWSLRAVYDALLFDAGVARMIGRPAAATSEAPVRVTAAMTVGAVILSTLAASVTAAPTALALTGTLAFVAFSAGAWLSGLEAAERRTVLSGLRWLSPRGRSSAGADTATEPVRDQAGRL